MYGNPRQCPTQSATFEPQALTRDSKVNDDKKRICRNIYCGMGVKTGSRFNPLFDPMAGFLALHT